MIMVGSLVSSDQFSNAVFLNVYSDETCFNMAYFLSVRVEIFNKKTTLQVQVMIFFLKMYTAL